MSTSFTGNFFNRLSTKTLIVLVLTAFGASLSYADVTRYPLPDGSTFPISEAVEVTADTGLVFLSGATPLVADASAGVGNPAYYGDTKAQTISAMNRIKANLEGKGLDLGDIIKLTVFLVGDPAKENIMDRDGFMEGYVEFFGTAEQPNLPARSAFQIARLSQPLMFIEIEAIAARK
ncbi:MAG: enamine deaminase RidA (YjgF/YER057c/UK114 family) [Pseudohongiellaceae bacterium]|jgi:enamine deaminase RidA (YjgF/YER057c/UK114 family)